MKNIIESQLVECIKEKYPITSKELAALVSISHWNLRCILTRLNEVGVVYAARRCGYFPSENHYNEWIHQRYMSK